MPSTSGDTLPARRNAPWSRLAALALVLGGIAVVVGAVVLTGGGGGRDVSMRAAQAAQDAHDGDEVPEGGDGVVTNLEALHDLYGEAPDDVYALQVVRRKGKDVLWIVTLRPNHPHPNLTILDERRARDPDRNPYGGQSSFTALRRVK